MNLNPLDQATAIPLKPQTASPDALRKAATQFEAVLLMHLTSAMNSTVNDDEEPLFGGDGGTGLAKQMFSEQLATTMAQSGGVGLSDVILKQFGGAGTSPAAGKIKGLAETIYAIRDTKPSISANKAFQNELTSAKGQAAMPISMSALTAGDPNDAEVISTFEGQLRAEGIDDSLANLILDGKVVNTTRARIVPNAEITMVPTAATAQPAVLSPTPPPEGPAINVAYHIPVAGRISSGFGNRFHPIDKKVKFHGGIDIAVPTGTTVGAAADGVVKFAGPDGNYGNLVVIRHPDGRETRYGHLSKILVAADQPITSGQPIALSGSTGKSTGPHLHFEVRENGKAVNPIKIVSNVFSNNDEK